MSMKQYEGKITSLNDTPFGYTLSMIGGKWRLVILYWIVEYETIRFNELHRKNWFNYLQNTEYTVEGNGS